MRIVLILINPSAGGGEHTTSDQTFKKSCTPTLTARAPWRRFFSINGVTCQSGARFGKLYLDETKGYGLELSEIATANISWCAELSNRYKTMLERCFKWHTLPLLRDLKPDAVLLAGNDTTHSRALSKRRARRSKSCPLSTTCPSIP